MAKTFEQWMSENGMTTGAGPNFVYGRPGYNQAQGLSGDRSTAVLNWQREQSAGALSDLLAGANQQGNPFGAVPTVDTGNRFEAGLSDTESRLRALLDDPDSIKQSAAYKFRVGQGQEALQRESACLTEVRVKARSGTNRTDASTILRVCKSQP